MTKYFDCDIHLVQALITFFTLGLGVGQLLAGPVSDCIGRRKPLIVGLLIQIIMLCVILFSTSITALIFARFWQGVGAAFMMVAARAVLADTYSGSDLKKQYTYITASFALGPIIAPVIGGYLQYYFEWHANFIFILVYAALIAGFGIIRFRETISATHAFSWARAVAGYRHVLTNSFFRASLLMASMAFGYVAIFNVTGPFILQESMGYNSIDYGHVALMMGLAWFLGNMTNRVFVDVPWKTKSHFLLVAIILVGLVMFGLGLHAITAKRLIMPTFGIIYCAGFIFPIYVSEALSSFKEFAASANGLLFALIWIIFSMFTALGTMLSIHSIMPIALVFISMALVSYLFFLLIFRNHS